MSLYMCLLCSGVESVVLSSNENKGVVHEYINDERSESKPIITARVPVTMEEDCLWQLWRGRLSPGVSG